MQDSVEMCFNVIGEALSQLGKIDATTIARVSEWRRIIGFRNQLVHGYSVMNDEITWKIVDEKLPILISELKTLLSEA